MSARAVSAPASRAAATYALFVAPIAFDLLVLQVLGGFSREPWGDEGHFYETVRLFAHGTVSIADYPEVVPPFVFAVYALWGKLFGLQLASLRVLSLLLAGTASALQFRLLDRFSGDRRLAIGVALYLAANPYFAGAGMFVYSDMLFQALALFAVLAFLARRPAWYALAAALALLTRQYGIVIVIAVGGIGLVSLVRGDRRAGVGWLLASAASLLPLAVLVVIWGGIGPPSGLERWTLGEPLRWRPGTFTTLVAMLAVYLLPVLAVRAGTLWREAKRSWWVVPAAAAFYIVFPVRASRVAVEQAGIETVGFVHRGLHAVLPGPGVDAALLLMFALGALVVAVFVRGLAAWPRAGFAGERGALAVIVLLFLLLLPLSYQNWEKYLLPVLPLAAALVIARFGAGESARVDTPAGNNRRNEQ